MHDIPNRIADVLLEVESILRTNNCWDDIEPPANALSSTKPFCIDTLTFQQWLQWIFLPRMKLTLEQSKPLPTKSGIYVYAQDYLSKEAPSTASLLTQIKHFDDLISIQSNVKRH